MNIDEFSSKMSQKAKQMGIEIQPKKMQQFYEYMNLLLQWNEKINLTAIVEKEEIMTKHFMDSLTILRYVKPSEKVLDIGTGAGFPGIPLGIMKTETSITLLDSLQKRILFLQDVIQKIDLYNVIPIHARAEEMILHPNKRQAFDLVVSRAVASLPVLLEYMLPYVKINGCAICMKGPEIEKEMQEAQRALKELGGKIEKVDNMMLPQTDIQRNLIIIRKEKETPIKYPRKAGIPTKKPIV